MNCRSAVRSLAAVLNESFSKISFFILYSAVVENSFFFNCIACCKAISLLLVAMPGSIRNAKESSREC
ncbi:hypothetical protein Trydic_g1153 [Trypoxylus dichotomus]